MSDSANLTPDNDRLLEAVRGLDKEAIKAALDGRDLPVRVIANYLEPVADLLRKEKAARDAAPADLRALKRGDRVLVEAEFVRQRDADLVVVHHYGAGRRNALVSREHVHPAAPPAQPASQADEEPKDVATREKGVLYPPDDAVQNAALASTATSQDRPPTPAASSGLAAEFEWYLRNHDDTQDSGKGDGTERLGLWAGANRVAILKALSEGQQR